MGWSSANDIFDPAIVEAFRRNGVVVHCSHEGGPNGDWACELERYHDSDHEDYIGRTWSREDGR